MQTNLFFIEEIEESLQRRKRYFQGRPVHAVQNKAEL